MRLKEEIVRDSLNVWQSYYDQIEMTQEDKDKLDKLDTEYSEVLKSEGGKAMLPEGAITRTPKE